MIGVLARPEQAAAVEEFFQLFKTPWESAQPDRRYDVIITSTGGLPEIVPRLLIVLGAGEAAVDGRFGVSALRRFPQAVLRSQEVELPLFGEVVTLAAAQENAICTTPDGWAIGVRLRRPGMTVLRLGYDFFVETERILASGQPPQWADTATLEGHIRLLRGWLHDEGIPFVEVPPFPSSHPFFACLTHDIDFVGIRRHFCDHTMWGFLGRATLGSLRRLAKGEISFYELLRNWLAALSLPLVYLGWAKDFWLPFEWYLKADNGLPSTYYLVPFKGRPGTDVSLSHAKWRATRYDVTDIVPWVSALLRAGSEIGVHGIDSWHDVESARREIERIRSVTGQRDIGVRMHWLLRSPATPEILERSGYLYDSSEGYNETVGYRCGTAQVIKPLGAERLLELPVLIQDGALFYSGRLGLTEIEAWQRCLSFIEEAREQGGVLTVIWHDRSPHPERLWGCFYLRLIERLKSDGAWFGTAGHIVGWYRRRRDVSFSVSEEPGAATRIVLSGPGVRVVPPLRVRIHRPGRGAAGVEIRETVDLEWTGDSSLEIELAKGPGRVN